MVESPNVPIIDVGEELGLPCARHYIEREITGLPPVRRLAGRTERRLPLLADLRIWMETERRPLSNKNKLAKALQYSLSRWNALQEQELGLLPKAVASGTGRNATSCRAATPGSIPQRPPD